MPMRYQICEADSAEKLQRAVEDRLRQGWRPLGGLSVVNSHNSGNWWYFQALVLDGKERAGYTGDPEFR